MSKNWQHEPFDFAPTRKPGGGWILWKSAPSAPAAPDYLGAAVATAAGNRDSAIAAQEGSMVNQVTPYGNLNYSQTGTSANNNPTYTASVELNPTGQQLLNYSNATQLGLGGLQSEATGRVANTLSQPFDQTSVNDIYNKSYALNQARLDPQWAQNDQTQASNLANQGIMQGSEAYNNAMRTYGQSKNDAYNQAQQSAIATMPQTFQLGSAARNQPINELSALMTGSQVQNPSFVSTPQQQATPGANYLGAAQAQGQYDQGLYNSQVGQSNSQMGGLFSLGAAAMPTLLKMSDRRLKSEIKRIGTHDLGIGIYHYTIAGIETVGVMADEVLQVKPEAVTTLDSGYMAVNYDML